MKEWLDSLKEEATPSIDEMVGKLSSAFPLLLELKNTVQDKEWHGEGDVYIHTGMVLEELYELLKHNFSAISGERRQALIVATLLHDIAKPITTKEAEVRGGMHIIAPRHEPKGRSYICFFLMDLPLSYNVVQMVMALVGEHLKPKKLAKEGSEGAFWLLSRMVDIELLYLLEVADMKGRVCSDMDANLEMMELFRMYAEEYGCWKASPYDLWNDSIKKQSGYTKELLDITIAQSKRDKEAQRIYTTEEAVARSFKYRDGFSDVVLLCGLSGSGKSTYRDKYLAEYNLISLDGIRKELYGKEHLQGDIGRVLQLAKERLKGFLRNNEKVVWDATNIRRDFRGQVIDLVRDYGGMVTLVFLHTTIKEAMRGNRDRERNVPQDVLEKQISSFEYPTVDEVDRMVSVNRDGDVLWRVGFYGD